ncbi:MAG: molybdopterin molybdotransferase MoeA [Gemmatimonadota bacterium]
MTGFETRPPDWLSVGEALARVIRRVTPLETERVSVQESLGRALAAPVVAQATLPPWDNSAMDGYAVRHRDLLGASPASPKNLRVVGKLKAGDPEGPVLGEGEAVRIMTGAPLPSGADAVVRVEDTDAEADPGIVWISLSPEAGKDIRPGGQDMRAGENLLPAGTTVGPGQIGLLAASGTEGVLVRRRPRVAVLSNGNEIAPSAEFHRVKAGQAIPETNAPTLSAAVRAAGCIPLHLGIAKDTKESILDKVRLARELKADTLLTSGGASMGEFDLVKRVLDGEGLDLDFWRVKMRPGTPFSFGHLPNGTRTPLPVFGLPGNPASSFVTFQVFVRPFLLGMAGHARNHRPVVSAEVGEALRSPHWLTHFFRVLLTGAPSRPIAILTGSQTSGLVRSQGLASGLAVVPEGVQELGVGQGVRVILLDDFGIGGGEPGYLEG